MNLVTCRSTKDVDVATCLLDENLNPVKGTGIGFRLCEAGRIHNLMTHVQSKDIPEFISGVTGIPFHYGMSVRQKKPKTKKQFYNLAYQTCGSRKWFVEQIISDVKECFPEQKSIPYGDIWEMYIGHCCMNVLYMYACNKKEESNNG